jgi:hypothetical protein
MVMITHGADFIYTRAVEENFEIPTFTRFIGPNLTTDILKIHFLGNF